MLLQNKTPSRCLRPLKVENKARTLIAQPHLNANQKLFLLNPGDGVVGTLSQNVNPRNRTPVFASQPSPHLRHCFLLLFLKCIIKFKRKNLGVKACWTPRHQCVHWRTGQNASFEPVTPKVAKIIENKHNSMSATNCCRYKGLWPIKRKAAQRPGQLPVQLHTATPYSGFVMTNMNYKPTNRGTSLRQDNALQGVENKETR